MSETNPFRIRCAKSKYIPCDNDSLNVDDLETSSYDYRQESELVPNGVTATAQGLRVPESKRLSSVRMWSVLAPAAAEFIVIRIFRARGDPSFSFTNMIVPFTLDSSSFPGAGIQLDLSGRIIPGVDLEPNDFFTISFDHFGPQQLRPLNVNWNTSVVPWPPSPLVTSTSPLVTSTYTISWPPF